MTEIPSGRINCGYGYSAHELLKKGDHVYLNNPSRTSSSDVRTNASTQTDTDGPDQEGRVALFPIVKKQNEVMAMGFVGSRLLEAATIMLGIVSLATIVTLRRNGAGADATVTGDALVAMYDRTFLFGQSFLPAVNALLLGTLMYRSRLVPRVLPLLGLIGAPLLIAAQAGVLFDLWDRSSAATGLGALPIAIWEFSLGLYLVIKGFRPTAIDTLVNRPDPLWQGHQPSSLSTTS